jgi:hypothetical protein
VNGFRLVAIPSRVCCFLLFGANIWGAQDTDVALRDRFLDSVRQSARSIERLQFRVSYVNTTDYASLSETTNTNAKRRKKDLAAPRIREYCVAVRGSFALQSATGDNERESVMAKNDTYAFRVERRGDIGQYSLTFVEQLSADSAADARIEEADVGCRLVPLGSWYIFGHPLSYFVDSPGLKIKRVSAVQSNGEELVRVDFDHLVDDTSRSLEQLSDAFVVCNPAKGWALTEYGATVGQANRRAKYHATIELGDLVDGFAIPSKLTILTSVTDDPETIRRFRSELVLLNREVAAEEFYLNHYGLPEPSFGRGWFGPWFWYLVGGIVCIGIGVIMIRRRRSWR